MTMDAAHIPVNASAPMEHGAAVASTTTRPSIDSVQYLRGIAATAVVFSHALGHPLPHDTRDLLVTGRLGVLLFFVISGFIMVFVTGAGRFDARAFLVKRIVRVVPFYWVVTAFAALTAIVAPSAFKATIVTLPHFVASLLFIPMENPAKAGAVLPLVKLGWTLNYEMFFYVVFACLAGVLLRTRLLVIAIVFAALVAVGQGVKFETPVLIFYTAHVLLGFVAGMAIGAWFMRSDFSKIGGGAVTIAALLGLGLFAASYAFEREHVTAYSLSITLVMIAACALLLFLGLWLEVNGRLIRSRALHFIGDASYSIYLVHLFGVGFAVEFAKRLHVPLSGLGYGAIVVGAFIVGMTVGYLAYVYVEKPLTTRLQRTLARPSSRSVSGR